MSVWDGSARRVVRAFLRAAERRIDRAGELGVAARAPAEAPPVLLVHGYGNDSRSMRALERSLTRDGFRVTTIDLPSFGCGDLLADAALVRERARAIASAADGEAVDVVGHSRGGIVARVALQGSGADPGVTGEDVIRRVVTIASANQGFHLGPLHRLAERIALADMRPLLRGSAVLTGLAETADAFDLVAIGTGRIDHMLVPASAARIEGAPFSAVDDGRTLGPISRIGHWRILRDDRSYELIRDALVRQRAVADPA